MTPRLRPVPEHAPPVLIDPPPREDLLLASLEDVSAVQDDRWVAGWNARREATMHDLAVGRRNAIEEGRRSVRFPLLLLCLVATSAFILGVLAAAAVNG